jgi:hypothetical protein
MTTRAIYGNFKNRDDLFIALGQACWAPIVPSTKRGASFAAIMRSMAEATIAALPDRGSAAVGRLTGLAYTLTHSELRAQVTEIMAQSYALGKQWLRAVTKEADLDDVITEAFSALAKDRKKKVRPVDLCRGGCVDILDS